MAYEWMKELKAGDLVFISGHNGKSLRRVEKITPKGFVKVGNELYNPDTGFQRGCDPWYPQSLMQATDEAVEKFQKNALIRSTLKIVQGLKASDITYEQAEEIRKILHIGQAK